MSTDDEQTISGGVLGRFAYREGVEPGEALAEILNTHGTVKGAAEFFGVSREMVHRWIRNEGLRKEQEWVYPGREVAEGEKSIA